MEVDVPGYEEGEAWRRVEGGVGRSCGGEGRVLQGLEQGGEADGDREGFLDRCGEVTDSRFVCRPCQVAMWLTL